MILVDAHVHIYDCFDLETFLDSALKNFKAEAACYGQEDSFTALLLLTETAKENWFHRLAGYAGGQSGTGTKSIGNWTFHRTNESCSLYAQSGSAQSLFLIVGHIFHGPWSSDSKCRATGRDHRLHPGTSKKRTYYRKDDLRNEQNETRSFQTDNHLL